jgi:two-component system, sensor histidine kinase YesM
MKNRMVNKVIKTKEIAYQYISDMSFFYKIISGIVIIVFFIVIIYTFTFYEYSKSTYEKEAMGGATKLVEDINTRLEDNMENVDRIINAFYADSNITKYISNKKFINTLDQYNFLITMDDFFRQLLFTRRDFNSIYLYVSKDKNYSYALSGINKLDYDPTNEGWYKKTIEKGGKTVISTPHKPYQLLRGEEVISFSKALISPFHSPVVVLADFSMKSFENLIQESKYDAKTNIVFLDNGGNLIFSNSHAMGKDFLPQRIIDEIRSTRSGTYNIVVSKQKYFLAYNTSNISGWKVLTLTPFSVMTKDLQKLIVFAIFMSIIALGLTLLLAYVFSKAIFKPIYKLKEGMIEVKGGNFNIHLQSSSKDEMGQLVQHFNSMIITIKTLIFEKYEEKIARREAEFKYLQSQINPHFLYNTLQIISSMAVFYKTPDISNTSISLAKMLRYSINPAKKTVEIKDEIENVTCYLDIQKLRFKDFLNYDVEIDEALSKYKIIKLILQPIVENSIIHGIEKKGITGIIKIRGYISSNTIYIEVYDNGAGMTENQINEIIKAINLFDENEELTQESINSNIALKNINQRIKLVYGNEYGLIIESAKDEWTKVTICIPVNINEVLYYDKSVNS